MQLNSSKPIAGLAAMCFVVYLVYTLLATDPLVRMNRMCTPVTLWPGRIIVSGARIFSPESAPGLQQSFNNGFGTCRTWVWGVMYRDDYIKAKAAEAQRQAAGAADAANKDAPAQ